MINIGENQSVVLGTQFEVIKEPEPIEYRGRMLKGSPKASAQVEVIQVEADFSMARMISQEEAVRPDDKIREKIVDLCNARIPFYTYRSCHLSRIAYCLACLLRNDDSCPKIRRRQCCMGLR